MIWDVDSMLTVRFFMKTVYMGQLTFLGTDFSVGCFLSMLVSIMVTVLSNRKLVVVWVTRKSGIGLVLDCPLLDYVKMTWALST